MERWAEQELYGWARHPRVTAEVARPERRREVEAALADRGDKPVLAHGLGRSYGDAALIDGGRVVLTRRLDKMLGFDPETGWVRVEAGVSIQDLIDTFLPRGWFVPVVPGTQFVTVGGAIANDIHGKNHHSDGTFCDHVRRVELLTAKGEVVICDAETEPDLFWATVAGLGLTGIILSAEIKLAPVAGPWIEMESIRLRNLDHFFEESANSKTFSHVVTWLDSVAKGGSMGRGILMRGRHAAPGVTGGGVMGGVIGKVTDALEPVLDVPFDLPDGLMNTVTMRLFNEAYYRKHPKGTVSSVVHYKPYFFPLDAIRNWNRGYGPRGMVQYQLVVPPDPQNAAMREVLKQVSESGMPSFLTVMKEFGDTTHPWLSFPRPGMFVALDFPRFGPALDHLLDRLDALVVEAGGRIYLGKDSRMSKETFRAMYPDWRDWKAVRDAWDPDDVFQSTLGRRLGLCGGAA